MKTFNTEEEAIAHGEEMAQLKDEVEQDIEKIASEDTTQSVVYDLEGNTLTEEQAKAQEQELQALADRYFQANPTHEFRLDDWLEDDDDESHVVKVNDDMEVVSETKETVKEVEKEVIVQKSGFVEQTIIKRAVNECLRETRIAYDQIEKDIDKHLPFITDGVAHFDNLNDAFRKDVRYMTELLMAKNVDIDSIENDRVKRNVKAKIEQMVDAMMDFSTHYDTYKTTLEVLCDD